MSNKYVCPICGNKLKAWKEYSYCREVLINPKTGKSYKTIIQTKPEEIIHREGLQCINDECGFIINTVLDNIDEFPKYLDEIKWEL